MISAANLDPSALTLVTRKLEDVLDSKNGAIRDLQYELARVCKVLCNVANLATILKGGTYPCALKHQVDTQ